MLGQTPVLILKEGTKREKGKGAQFNNIAAARAIADAVRSTLGPLSRREHDPAGYVEAVLDSMVVHVEAMLELQRRGAVTFDLVVMLVPGFQPDSGTVAGPPPTIGPCYYGIDTPLRRDLIAATHTLEEINTYLTSDTVGYLTMQGLHACVPNGRTTYCDACFSGSYTVPLESEETGEQLPLFRGSVRI